MQKTSCYRVTALSPVCLYFAIGGYISVQSRAVFEKQFWRINATKCIDKSISRKNEARRSGGSTQIWEKCGKRDRLSNRNPDTLKHEIPYADNHCSHAGKVTLL